MALQNSMWFVVFLFTLEDSSTPSATCMRENETTSNAGQLAGEPLTFIRVLSTSFYLKTVTIKKGNLKIKRNREVAQPFM